MTEIRFEVDENGIAYTYINGIKGTLNYYDTETLIHEIVQNDPSVYVETGSYLGCSSVISALHSNALVYAHDLWVQDFDTLDISSAPPPEVENYFKQFYTNVKSQNLQNRIIPIRGDSKFTLDAIHDDESIDFAFIDGDHSEDGIYGDLITIFPKMKVGGVILCHDCVEGTETYKGLLKFTKDFESIPNTCGMVKIIKR